MLNHTAIKFEQSGHANLKQRLHVKAFADINALGAFMSKQSDNKWQSVCVEKQAAQKYPVKSGIYAFAGGQWHNVKTLDASVLAHI